MREVILASKLNAPEKADKKDPHLMRVIKRKEEPLVRQDIPLQVHFPLILPALKPTPHFTPATT